MPHFSVKAFQFNQLITKIWLVSWRKKCYIHCSMFWFWKIRHSEASPVWSAFVGRGTYAQPASLPFCWFHLCTFWACSQVVSDGVWLISTGWIVLFGVTHCLFQCLVGINHAMVMPSWCVTNSPSSSLHLISLSPIFQYIFLQAFEQ